jgi:thiol-disulfide isomerase/thioredoxin
MVAQVVATMRQRGDVRMRRKGAARALAIVLALCAAWATAATASPQIGEVPPDLLGKTPKGEEVRISGHRGQVLVVTFWASWCPHCRRQFPVLDALQRHDPARLRVVVVNYKEDPATYRAVLRQARDATVTWTHDRSGAISGAYGVDSVPHTFVIDKAGRVAGIRRGYSQDSLPEFAALLDELLAEPVPPADDATGSPLAQAGAPGG